MPFKRFNEDFNLAMPAFNEEAFKHVNESLLTEGDVGQQGLEVTIEAIHEGLTRNDTFYTKEGLTNEEKDDRGQKGGLESWTSPYQAPILLNHDTSVDPIGRVKSASWVEKAGKTPGHVALKALITNPEAIQKFLRGEYQTGSIGMDVDHANCSVCGMDRMENWCEHQRGKWYTKAPKGSDEEGKWLEALPHAPSARRMHIQIGNVWAREYSIVNIPSDMRSKVASFQLVESVFTEAGGAQHSLLEAPAFTEEVKTQEDKPPVEKTTTQEETPAVTFKEAFSKFLEIDPLSVYTQALSSQLFGVKMETSVGDVVIAAEGPELSEYLEYIVAENDELETEFSQIKEAVLSTPAELPDSAFALIHREGGKTVARSLPYKDAQGQVVPEKLIVGLSRWNQVSGFDAAESAKALRKLVAAATKHGFGNDVPAEELEAEITAAKAFLEANGISLTPSPSPEVEQLKEQVSELSTIVQERELENTELVEALAEMQEAAKQAMIEKIILLQETEEEKLEETRTALGKESSEKLTAVLETLESEKPDGTLIVTRLVRTAGAAPAGNSSENTEVDLQKEDILAAWLGQPSKKAKLSRAIRTVMTGK